MGVVLSQGTSSINQEKLHPSTISVSEKANYTDSQKALILHDRSIELQVVQPKLDSLESSMPLVLFLVFSHFIHLGLGPQVPMHVGGNSSFLFTTNYLHWFWYKLALPLIVFKLIEDELSLALNKTESLDSVANIRLTELSNKIF